MFQDWSVVSWDKRGQKSKNESNKEFLNNQIRKNNVSSVLKNNAPNKNQNNIVSTNLKKIENEEDTFIHKKVTLSVSKKIAQARCEKKLTQKDLANLMFVPIKTIQDYENGKAIPNHVILNKIEKILNTRVRD